MINRHTSGINYLVLSILASSFFIVSCDAFATSYSIIYDDNVVSNMPTDVNDKTFGTTVTVTSTIPTRPGYSNIGWCSVIPTYLNGVDTCTGGTQYDASDDLTIDQTGSSNDFHLYAMWQASIIPPSSCSTPVPNVTYMQEFATMSSSEKTTVLNSMTEDSQYYLADSRDEKTYCVSKLKDGNIWMTQNLDFDIVDGGANLDSTETDVPSDWADAGKLADSYDVGEMYWNGSFWPNTQASCEAAGGTYNNNICYGADLTSSTGNSHYHLGNYYNWVTAVAMDSDAINDMMGEDIVDQSICPAGWRLPATDDPEYTVLGNGSFYYLLQQYGWDWDDPVFDNNMIIWDTPIYMALSGNLSGSDHSAYATAAGYGGYYWSSMSYGPLSYSMSDYVSGSIVVGDLDNGREYGLSVRCLTR